MDFEDSFASAPVRYALDDIDSEEELEASLQYQKLVINTELAPNFESDSKMTLVFGLEGPGNVYLQSLQSTKTKDVGSVTRSFDGKAAETKADIIKLQEKPVLLIRFMDQVSAEETGQYTRSILNAFKNKVERVIVLDSFTAVGYTLETRGDDDFVPPFLRVLQTSSAKPVKNFMVYESPNMIKGLSASIVNYCEIHSISCYDLLTLQESIYGKLLVTNETLEAYHQGLAQLGLELAFSEELMEQFLTTARHTGRVDDGHHRLYL